MPSAEAFFSTLYDGVMCLVGGIISAALRARFRYEREMEHFLFVLSILFASVSARLHLSAERKKTIEQTNNNPFHARSGNEPQT